MQKNFFFFNGYNISFTFAAMFQRLTAVVLLAALISANCSRFFIYAGFELNHKYIAENLCINKSRPWLHCNGKCYFMKKIRQAEENEKKQQREDQKSRYQEALPVLQPLSILAFKEPHTKVIYARKVSPEPVERAYAILLPPKVA